MITQNEIPMFACGSALDRDPGFIALTYFIIGLWLVTLVLFLVNVYLTFAANSSSFKIVNAQILVVYTILGLVLFTCWNSMGFPIGGALVFIIPFMVLVHFICLLVSVRRRKRRLENASPVDAKKEQNQS